MNAPTLQAELEHLLNEDIESVRLRERTAFDEVAGPLADRLVLFGAGNLGRRTLAGLRTVGIEPLAFADSNSALWGDAVEGIPVLSPVDAARQFGQQAAFVVTIWRGEGTDRMGARVRQLRELGCQTVVTLAPLYWKCQETFLPHYLLDAPHLACEAADDIRRAFTLWSDEASQREFLAQLRLRLLGDFDALPPPVSHPIYFPDDLVSLVPDEVFVDCGAYDGDTIQDFVGLCSGRFRRIVAFEPDPANCDRLQQCVSNLPTDVGDRVDVHCCAVGAHQGTVSFAGTGTAASAVGSGTLEVDCVTLDGILEGCAPTYIKMDIEGAELDALMGGAHLIGEHKPVLAVCVYHRQDHVWRVPLLLHALSDDYRLFLRPHLLEAWDTVCYAIPVGRLREGTAE